MNAMKEKLVSICTPRQWKTLSTSELKDEGYTVYGANGVIGYYNEYNHEVETVMVTCRGATCGTVNISKPYSYINGNAMCMDDLRHDIDVKYLYYALKHYDFREVISGSAQPQITRQSLNNVFIEVVGQNKQLEIVKILSNIEESIITKQRLLYEYDQLIKSRFVEMFGDVFSRKSKFKTKKIGELVISKVERASKYFDSESEIKYIDISSIDNSNNVITGYTQYFMKDAPSRAQQHVKKHDILISTVRPNLNNVAKVQYDFDNLVASSGFCVLRSTEIEPEYLFSFVSRNEFANYLSSLTTGASYPAVSDKDILNIEIPYPPKDKQLEFVNFHRQVDKLKFVVQKSLDETQKLFDSLMQEYFG
jgi:type I restriction enzyme S subunit